MLWAVLWHFLGQLVVHVISDTLGCIFLHLIDSADDLCFYRPGGRECLHDGLCLEPDRRLGEDRREHSARTIPRFSAFFIFHAEYFESLDEGVCPFFSGHDVGFH